MSKAKKTILTIAAVFFGLLIIFNTVGLIFLWSQVQLFFNAPPYTFFSYMEPTGNFISIDDVGYIREEDAVISPERAASGEEVKIYRIEELIAEVVQARSAEESGETAADKEAD